jgi:hypothetical protein
MVERQMNDELEGIWNGEIVSQSTYFPGIFQEGLRKTTKSLSQNSRRLDGDSNRAPPEQEFRTLPLHQITRSCGTNEDTKFNLKLKIKAIPVTGREGP